MLDCISYFTDGISAIYIFFWLSFFWHSYLEYREYHSISAFEQVPEVIKHAFSKVQMLNARAYQLDLIRFSFVYALYSNIELSCILYFELLINSWALVEQFCSNLGFDSSHDILYSQVWILFLNIVFSLLHQPWKLYKIFIIEQNHGFNNMSISLYFLELFKNFVINQIILLPIISVFIFIVQCGGDSFYLHLWAFLSFTTLLLLWIYPTWIAPIFDSYTPLKFGELRDMIQGLSEKVSFPLTNIYIVNSSRKSAHSNAYFYGFWRNQRIVLFDTLLTQEDSRSPARTYEPNFSLKEERYTEVLSEYESSSTTVTNGNNCTFEKSNNSKLSKSEDIQGNFDSENSLDPLSDEEVLAIVCHELGHWVYQHNLKSLLINELVLFAYISLFSSLLDNSQFYIRFGFLDSQPIIVGIVVIFGFIFAPIDLFLSFCINFLNRRFEYSADAFTAKMGMESLLSSALIKITRNNKSFPINDPIYSIFHNHHPSTLERLKALNNYKTE